MEPSIGPGYAPQSARRHVPVFAGYPATPDPALSRRDRVCESGRPRQILSHRIPASIRNTRSQLAATWGLWLAMTAVSP